MTAWETHVLYEVILPQTFNTVFLCILGVGALLHLNKLHRDKPWCERGAFVLVVAGSFSTAAGLWLPGTELTLWPSTVLYAGLALAAVAVNKDALRSYFASDWKHFRTRASSLKGNKPWWT